MTLTLREPRLEDEAQATGASAELAREGFDFTLQRDGEAWSTYIDRVARESLGVGLEPGRVPATMLFAFEGGELIGRVHIRHKLTDFLLAVGGNIGYAVRPAFRRHGYATELLGAGLEHLRSVSDTERALVTCDDDNVGSARTIEACGGVLENVVAFAGEPAKRRYWIDL